MDTIISRREKERRMREDDIVDAAEQVFSTTGYSGASMEEIAKHAQFTRKTIYQYFADKEDLYFAVIIRGFQKLLCYFEEETQDGKTGFEKLKNLSYAYYKFYKDFPKTLELMNYVGYIKSRKEPTPKHQEFNKITELVAQKIAKIINEGKEDGSIRKDIDTMSGTYSAEFSITGFFHMLSVSGKTFLNHFSLNEEQFIQFNINLLCDAFRSKNS